MPTLEQQGVLASPRYSYHKLPQQLFFNLSILKLDGSSFDVQVARTASVAELKAAVEDVFVQSPPNDDIQRQISWSHVWGHFCLCFVSHKLVNDKAYIRSFGIKDGDQLFFMRHLSLNCSPIRKQLKDRSATYEHPTKLFSGSEASEDKMENRSGDQFENGEDDGGGGISRQSEFKLSHFFRGLQKYSRRWNGVSRMKTEEKLRPSKYSVHFLRVGTNKLQDFRRS